MFDSLTFQTTEGEDDLKKGTQLLEIYALEIQMYTAQKNNKKLKALYEQSLHIKSAIPHPLIMGVIRGRDDILNTFKILGTLQFVLSQPKCNKPSVLAMQFHSCDRMNADRYMLYASPVR